MTTLGYMSRFHRHQSLALPHLAMGTNITTITGRGSLDFPQYYIKEYRIKHSIQLGYGVNYYIIYLTSDRYNIIFQALCQLLRDLPRRISNTIVIVLYFFPLIV